MNEKEKFKYLSNETNKLKENLQKKYWKMGKKVKIEIVITYLILLTGCICAGDMPESPQTFMKKEAEMKEGLKPITNVGKPIEKHPSVIETTTTLKSNIVYKTIVRYKYQNITINVTSSQIFYLKNLKPKSCHSSACSNGYFKCKTEVLDFLNIKHGYSFYEGPSREASRKIYNETWIPVRFDNFTYYVELNKTMWYLEENDEKWRLRRIK